MLNLLLHTLVGLIPVANAFWLPERGSTTAHNVDFMFNLVLGISVFFFALITVLTIYFMWRYRRREGVDAEKSAKQNIPLELVWTFIPIVVVAIIFYFGFTGYMNMRVSPEESVEILVTGQKWQWFFTYPNGHVDGNLHVPVDEPVRLVMTSEDVIHSLYIPAFRTKMDLVPGRYSETWFEASKTGKFVLLCAEYCGTGHSDMTAFVEVHEPGGFEKWLEDAADFVGEMAPAEAGELLFTSRGCTQCHRVDGTDDIGPSFNGLYEKQVQTRDEGTVVADENYLRESIIDPQSKIVTGYDPVMPTYKGKLKDKEITAIIEYIKTLK